MRMNPNTTIGDLLDYDPEMAEVLADCGMHCLTCPSAARETLSQAAAVHGIPVEQILEAIQDFQSEKAERGF